MKGDIYRWDDDGTNHILYANMKRDELVVKIIVARPHNFDFHAMQLYCWEPYHKNVQEYRKLDGFWKFYFMDVFQRQMGRIP